LSRQTETGEKLQRSVNCGIANLGIDLYNPGINLSEVLMAGGVEENIKNLLSLFRCLQPFFGNPLFKSTDLDKMSFLKLKSNFILIGLVRFVKGQETW
jgi:hypothetical protein